MSVPNLLERAKAAGVMIATAESCTGGMVAVALTDVAGSSAVFERGFVTYTNAAKIDMLGVAGTTLDTYGAVSEQVAQEMANGALRRSNAQLSVSITGIAGPGGSDGGKPEGRVCFALAGSNSPPHSETMEFGPIGRSQVREKSRDHALMLLERALS